MKCQICDNEFNNTKIVLKEMMFGMKDEFDYFRCGNCGCIQIENIPENIGKYYPETYYSYNTKEVPLKRSKIRSIHFDYYAFQKHKILGGAIALKFRASLFYEWLKNLKLSDRNQSVLDVGCGDGRLLKRMYRLGFNDLTGIDPFLQSDKVYNKNIRLYKKNIFEMDRKFDVIMMHHSLEHMTDQEKVLQKAATLLHDNGRMLIRIPIVSKPLMEKYGANVATLDAPRHFFIHSQKSIADLIAKASMTVYKTVFDSDAFSILASEQYSKGVSIMNDDRSYIQNKNSDIFTKEELRQFEEDINLYNQRQQSDYIALYIKKD